MGAYGAGIFHLMTHAFFKGLLFLMAGSVMHALHGELNIFRMDRLWDQMPLTGTFAIVGGLGLSGFPLISGFWSKDEILLASIGHGEPFELLLFVVLSLAALLTAFYTFRMIFEAFFAGNKDEMTYDAESVHDCGWKMALPMGLLGIGTIFGGYFGTWTHQLVDGHGTGHGFHTLVMGVSIAVSLLGIGIAYLIYVSQISSPLLWLPGGSVLHRTIREQYYVERLYRNLIVRPFRWSSDVLWKVFDDLIVDGFVNLSSASIEITGLILRFLQTGYIRHYLIYITAGFTLVLSIVVLFWGTI